MQKLSKAQYEELICEIQKAIKKHAMKGGGAYDFAAAETYVEQLPDVPFYIHVDGMEGGGIKDKDRGSTLTAQAAPAMVC